MIPARKVLFLDRDGVINEFPGKGMYVTRWDDFRFLPRSPEAIASLNRAGFDVFVISNQGCVSRKLITTEALADLTRRMEEGLAKAGARLSGVFYCEHQTSDACECKKPKTRLFRRAVEGREVDFSSVWFVGDSDEDMRAGKDLGCRTMMVLSGRTKSNDVSALSVRPDAVAADLWEASQWILEKP